MTDTPDISAEAPERIWVAYTSQVYQGQRGITVADKPAPGHVEMIALDAAEAREQAAVEAALKDAADRIDAKHIKPVQKRMTQEGQGLAANREPRVSYRIRRADLDARMSDRDTILALIPDTGSALDRMLDEARREEREACAIIAAEWEETFEKRDEEERSVGAGCVFRDIRARGEGA